MGTIKDRNCIDQTEAEILRRGGKNIQNHTKEIIMTQINIVITHLEPDILECEVKWALGSIIINKAREVIEIQLSYFKS